MILARENWHIRRPKKTLSQCHFVHHKSHVDQPGTEPRSPRKRPAINCLGHGTAPSNSKSHWNCIQNFSPHFKENTLSTLQRPLINYALEKYYCLLLSSYENSQHTLLNCSHLQSSYKTLNWIISLHTMHTFS
jgi:hypothetical protein